MIPTMMMNKQQLTIWQTLTLKVTFQQSYHHRTRIYHSSCTFSNTYCRSIQLSSRWGSFHPFCWEASYRHWSTWEPQNPENQRWQKSNFSTCCQFPIPSCSKKNSQKQHRVTTSESSDSSDNKNPVYIRILPVGDSSSVDEFIWDVDKRGNGDFLSPGHQVLMFKPMILIPP